MRITYLLPVLACLACGGSDAPSKQGDGSLNIAVDADSDGAGPGALTGCDPFAAKPLPIALGTVIAAGKNSASVIYVVDQVDSSQRVFVSDASGTLVRQRIAGSGSGPDFYVFDVSDRDSAFVLQIDISAAGTVRMGVLNGTLKDSKTIAIGQQGEELTVLPAGSVANMPVRNLPGDVVVEYVASLADGNVMVVTRPRDDWAYTDFRLFMGPMGAVAERTVSSVQRATDGGSTTIGFSLDGASVVASFPVVFADGGFAPGPATLTVGGTTNPLTRQGAQPAGVAYLCFGAPSTGPGDAAVAKPDRDGVDSAWSSTVSVDASVVKPDTESVDSASPSTILADAGVVRPDGDGANGAPLVPCAGDSGVSDSRYVCGSCRSDAYFPVVCTNGYLACPTSAAGVGMYVVDKYDPGQCAYMATYYYPGFGLADPAQSLTTARDPALPLALRAMNLLGRPPYTFAALFQDRALGESAIRSLVTVTDMTNNAPVAYAIGNPSKSAAGYDETLPLTPVSPLAANTWYRATIYPAETQQFVQCHTFSRSPSKQLTALETTDFYTYSRPMVGQMFVAYKNGTTGYLDFLFTEQLAAADLAANPAAVVFVDGVALSGCMMPYACSGISGQPAYDLRLDLAVVPTSFTEITLRVPHALKSVGGGTILDGTKDNPHVTIDGDFAVYTFKAADMVLTDSNLVKRWYYSAK